MDPYRKVPVATPGGCEDVKSKVFEYPQVDLPQVEAEEFISTHDAVEVRITFEDGGYPESIEVFYCP